MSGAIRSDQRITILQVEQAIRSLGLTCVWKTFRRVGINSGCSWALQGVCQTEEEYTRMQAQADNGNRRFYRAERMIDGQRWIGIYIGYKE